MSAAQTEQIERTEHNAETLSGAEVVVRLLERQGITTVAGIPGGAILPIYDALSGSATSTTYSPATSRAPASWRRAWRAPPANRRFLPPSLRPGRDQPVDGNRRRQARLGSPSSPSPARCRSDDRHRCLSGSRYLRPLHPDHQAQFPRFVGRGTAQVLPRPLKSPPPAAPARCWSISRRTTQNQRIEVRDYPGTGPAAGAAWMIDHSQGGGHDCRRRAPDPLSRRRRRAFPVPPGWPVSLAERPRCRR